ncbi:MAG: hypothetical protein C0602_12035 [Denitrovibrio sp.]|nr:MAG: hypothetical protein C0602_12035 [Denitrovibrio sp.]
MKLRKFFSGKNLLVFILVGLSFHILFKYRANVNAIPAGLPAPNLQLETLDGQDFQLYDFSIPVMLVFLNTKTFLSSSVYPDQILRRMPRLKLLEQRGVSGLVVLLDTDQTPEAVKKKLRLKKYKILENTVYLGNIKNAKEKYGLSSWPHFFLIDGTHTIAYESKIPSINTIDSILNRR